LQLIYKETDTDGPDSTVALKSFSFVLLINIICPFSLAMLFSGLARSQYFVGIQGCSWLSFLQEH